MISTHVLDTERGEPAEGVIVELYRGESLLAATQTDADGRVSELSPDALENGTYRLVFHPPSAFFRRVELEIAIDDPERHYHVPLARLALLVRELPRQLTIDQLEELFEGRTALVERLAEIADPLDNADEVISTLTEDEKLAALAAHPAIGQREGLSARSAAEQGTDEDRTGEAELAELNRRYEERFGFRFVVFVNRRPKAEIVPILHTRLERSRDEELGTALSELVAIARDRWQRG